MFFPSPPSFLLFFFPSLLSFLLSFFPSCLLSCLIYFIQQPQVIAYNATSFDSLLQRNGDVFCCLKSQHRFNFFNYLLLSFTFRFIFIFICSFYFNFTHISKGVHHVSRSVNWNGLLESLIVSYTSFFVYDLAGLFFSSPFTIFFDIIKS